MSANKAKFSTAPYRLLEFYSGIGGMRYAFEASGVPYVSVGAVDVNTVVNEIYIHNFGQESHFQRNIQSFKAEEIDKLHPDIITMSPPCQPFTRLGLKLDDKDPRSESFLHLMSLFCKLERKPQYVLLENVLGFEKSSARDVLTRTLENCGYTFQEFLLSPAQCGIPNSRTRYYILAKVQPLQFAFPVTGQILSDWPITDAFHPSKFPCTKCKGITTGRTETKCILKHFLEEQPLSFFDQFLVSSKTLKKYAMVLDIVEEDSQSSCCFTKGYGKYVHGAGSVLHPSNTPEVESAYHGVTGSVITESEKLEALEKLKLRYFTPQEVANLMCFPPSFSFPKHVTVKQQYKALGNSVNVFVVSQLLLLLLSEV